MVSKDLGRRRLAHDKLAQNSIARFIWTTNFSKINAFAYFSTSTTIDNSLHHSYGESLLLKTRMILFEFESHFLGPIWKLSLYFCLNEWLKMDLFRGQFNLRVLKDCLVFSFCVEHLTLIFFICATTINPKGGQNRFHNFFDWDETDETCFLNFLCNFSRICNFLT